MNTTILVLDKLHHTDQIQIWTFLTIASIITMSTFIRFFYHTQFYLFIQQTSFQSFTLKSIIYGDSIYLSCSLNYTNRKTKFKNSHNIGMITQIRKYPTRCKSEDNYVAINMVHTAKKRKYMHIEFSIGAYQNQHNPQNFPAGKNF